MTSLRMRVFEALRSGIIRGILPLGSTIVEQQVADQLGVSRTPVREALHKMEGIGLVERSDPRKPYVVRGFTAKDVDDIASVRILLEGAAIRRATPLLSREDFTRLHQLLEEMEGSATDPDSGGLHNTAHQQFHLYMAEQSENRYLEKLVTSVLDYAAMVWKAYRPSESHLASAQQSHRLMVDAMERGDWHSAQQILREHIELSLERTKQLIRRREESRGIQDFF
ncbi:MAG: GntR family transcriptional regulator [Bacillota bacterium]